MCDKFTQIGDYTIYKATSLLSLQVFRKYLFGMYLAFCTIVSWFPTFQEGKILVLYLGKCGILQFLGLQFWSSDKIIML